MWVLQISPTLLRAPASFKSSNRASSLSSCISHLHITNTKIFWGRPRNYLSVRLINAHCISHQIKAGLILTWFCLKPKLHIPSPALRWTAASFCLALGHAPTRTLCTSTIPLKWSTMKTQALRCTVFILNTRCTKFLSTSGTPFRLRSLKRSSNVKPINQRRAK